MRVWFDAYGNEFFRAFKVKHFGANKSPKLLKNFLKMPLRYQLTQKALPKMCAAQE